MSLPNITIGGVSAVESQRALLIASLDGSLGSQDEWLVFLNLANAYQGLQSAPNPNVLMGATPDVTNMAIGGKLPQWLKDALLKWLMELISK
jgi:hypothetical protein